MFNSSAEFSRSNQQKNQQFSQSVFVSPDLLESKKLAEKNQSKDDTSFSSEYIKDKITIKGIAFVTEKDYKKDDNCFVCKVPFSAFYRQHHCRLCANSTCDFCSSQRVNDNRVCDICFYKVKKIEDEKKKQSLIETLQKLLTQFQNYTNIESKNLEVLDALIQEEQQKTNFSQFQLQQNTELQQKTVKKLEDDRNSKKEIIDELDSQFKSKKQYLLQLERNPEGLDDLNDNIKLQEHEVQFREQTLEGLINHYQLLLQHIKEKESMDDISQLPNYKKAKDLDPDHVSTLIIQLDQEYPPDQYYKQQEEKIKQQLKEQYRQILNKNNSQVDQQNRTLTTSQNNEITIVTHNIRSNITTKK